jgi:hypothetical protein
VLPFAANNGVDPAEKRKTKVRPVKNRVRNRGVSTGIAPLRVREIIHEGKHSALSQIRETFLKYENKFEIPVDLNRDFPPFMTSDKKAHDMPLRVDLLDMSSK